MSAFGFRSLVALVTGARPGIGGAIAQALGAAVAELLLASNLKSCFWLLQAPLLALLAESSSVTVQTAAMAGMSAQTLAAITRCIPLWRAGRPDDTAAAPKFLASREAARITEQTIVVGGGATPPGAGYAMEEIGKAQSARPGAEEKA